MKQNIFNIIISIFVPIFITLATLLGVYNYAPISIFDPLVSEKTLGTSITTIQGTDTIKNSRTTINDNFTALNNGKIEISTTSLPLITTLSGLTTAGSLATVGTITSGTWSASTIAVNKGGTGATSFTQYRLLVGSSTNALSVTGAGTDGQLLTYSSSSIPYWGTPSIDQTANYTWSGTHTFNTATTTFNNVVLGAGFNRILVYTASSTWTKASGTTFIKVRVVGGGGTTANCVGNYGGGAGGGGYAEKIINVSGTSSVPVVVGTAGVTSSFGSYVSASAGSGGGCATVSQGGAGGVGTGGDFNANGQMGGNAYTTGAFAGNGGNSIYGGGGTGAVTNTVGGAGNNYGGGGGGGASNAGTNGSGGQGIVIIEY